MASSGTGRGPVAGSCELSSFIRTPQVESFLTIWQTVSTAQGLCTWSTVHHHHHHHHHHITVMEMGHLLTRSGLTYPEVFSESTMIPSARRGVVLNG